MAAIHLGVLHSEMRNITTLKRRMRNNHWQHEVFKITLKTACRPSIHHVVSRTTCASALSFGALRTEHQDAAQKCRPKQNKRKVASLQDCSAEGAESRRATQRLQGRVGTQGFTQRSSPQEQDMQKAFRNTRAHLQTVRRFIQKCAGGTNFSTLANFSKV